MLAVVLYGSAARGEAGAKSDIDLLIVVSRRAKKLKTEIGEIFSDAESRVTPNVLTDVELAKTPYFIFDVIRDGIVLYKNPSSALRLPVAFGPRAVTIYSFDINTLSQKNKVKFNSALYGATHKKRLRSGEIRRYAYSGLLQKTGGKKLGAGAFLVPSRAEREFDELLGSYKIKFEKSHFIFVEHM
ncbi:MAG: nucleotidyltransferase domain-containing protein [Candidatus Micrarchaeota archaeon]